MPLIFLVLLLFASPARAGTVLGTGDYCFDIEVVPPGFYEQLDSDRRRLAYRRASAEMDGGRPSLQELAMSYARVSGYIALAAHPYEGKDCRRGQGG